MSTIAIKLSDVSPAGLEQSTRASSKPVSRWLWIGLAATIVALGIATLIFIPSLFALLPERTTSSNKQSLADPDYKTIHA